MLPADVHDRIVRAAGLPRVVLASDFDGTLAPFHIDPMAVQPAPGSVEALREAAGLDGVTTALVSGRDLETLSTLSGVAIGDPVVLIGSHGAQSSRDDQGTEGLSEAQVALLATLEAELEDICTRYPGARVEHKAAARVLHTRGLDDAASDAALAAAEAVAARHPDVHVLSGKCVVELPVVEATKGAALKHLASATGSEAIVYFGDDVTDERAFAVMDESAGDLGVKVGEGVTSAPVRVDGVDDVVAALRLFVDTRTGNAG